MQRCFLVLLLFDEFEATSLPRKALKPGAPCSDACAAAMKALKVRLGPRNFSQDPHLHLTVPCAERAVPTRTICKGTP